MAGHGLHAAATMGRLRTAVHNFSTLDLPPDELLSRLDVLVGRIDQDEACTDSPAAVVGATCLYAERHCPVQGRRPGGREHPAWDAHLRRGTACDGQTVRGFPGTRISPSPGWTNPAGRLPVGERRAARRVRDPPASCPPGECGAGPAGWCRAADGRLMFSCRERPPWQ